MKKPYEKPAIIHQEAIESRATSCPKTDEVCRVQGGPIWS